MLLTTKSGYKVTIKDVMSFGDRRKLLRPILESAKFDATSGSVHTSDISGAYVFEMQDNAVRLLVTEIEFQDGTILTDNLIDIIQGWGEEDGQAVYDLVNKIAKLDGSSQEVEKKS